MPPEIYTWHRVEHVFWATLDRFAYEPVRTPIFEATDLFLRSVGEGTDIVSKEMYTFTDRGGRSLTLRPENTASVIRAYLENGLHRKGGIVRLAYIGPMFRYDRPQAGRYRQFHQVGAEAIGSLNPMLDVELIDVVMTGLEALGFDNLIVKINSVGCALCRADYTKMLRERLENMKDQLCGDCQVRAIKNPMRIFDCKNCVDIKKELPAIVDHLCEECQTHYARVKEYLRATARRFDEDPLLVRGLDYYTKTAFEILHHALGAQNALCGGGRYDNLVEQCGGPSTPAVGFSAGLERIMSVLPEKSKGVDDAGKQVDVYVACIDEAAAAHALRIAGVLRSLGRIEVDASLRTLKKQLKNAEKIGARATVIVDSASPNTVKWKDMAEREQFDVADADLAEFAAQRMPPS